MAILSFPNVTNIPSDEKHVEEIVLSSKEIIYWKQKHGHI